MTKVVTGGKGVIIGRHFPRPNTGPFTIKNERKLPKMVYSIPNLLVLHFGENFINIRTKIAKLQMQYSRPSISFCNEDLCFVFFSVATEDRFYCIDNLHLLSVLWNS